MLLMIKAREFTNPCNTLLIKIKFVKLQCLDVFIKDSPVLRVKKTSMLPGCGIRNILKLRIAESTPRIHDTGRFASAYIQYFRMYETDSMAILMSRAFC